MNQNASSCYRFLPCKAQRAQVMGILNVTPDSFSDGGTYFAPEQAIARAFQLQAQGADILDLGAQSTRPGHVPVPAEEELRRLLPVLEGLQALDIPLSVDTYHPAVAREALRQGARIINDVSGFANPAMAALIREHGAGWVLMHNEGGADAARRYSPNAVTAVAGALRRLAEEAMALGLQAEQLCLDPGIGFGKRQEDNLALLAATASLKVPGMAYLVGASRKRVIAAAAGGSAGLAGTIAAHVTAQLGGADILRVHDVKEARQAADVCWQLMQARQA